MGRMTKRIIFTKMFARLIQQMTLDQVYHYHPAIKRVYSSDEEQYRLFLAGVSKLDGKTKRSAHQDSMAGDIDLYDENGHWFKEWPSDYVKKYHDLWESWGGTKVISWDVGHFEWPK